MIELMRTNDIITLNFAEATLNGEGIEHFVADRHMSMMEGQIGAFPRRLMVPEGEAERARTVLREVGLGEFLSDRG